MDQLDPYWIKMDQVYFVAVLMNATAMVISF